MNIPYSCTYCNNVHNKYRPFQYKEFYEGDMKAHKKKISPQHETSIIGYSAVFIFS